MENNFPFSDVRSIFHSDRYNFLSFNAKIYFDEIKKWWFRLLNSPRSVFSFRLSSLSNIDKKGGMYCTNNLRKIEIWTFLPFVLNSDFRTRLKKTRKHWDLKSSFFIMVFLSQIFPFYSLLKALSSIHLQWGKRDVGFFSCTRFITFGLINLQDSRFFLFFFSFSALRKLEKWRDSSRKWNKSKNGGKRIPGWSPKLKKSSWWKKRNDFFALT